MKIENYDCDFSRIEHEGLRKAYETIFPKFMEAPTIEEKQIYWKLLRKLGDWELKQSE